MKPPPPSPLTQTELINLYMVHPVFGSKNMGFSFFYIHARWLKFLHCQCRSGKFGFIVGTINARPHGRFAISVQNFQNIIPHC